MSASEITFVFWYRNWKLPVRADTDSGSDHNKKESYPFKLYSGETVIDSVDGLARNSFS